MKQPGVLQTFRPAPPPQLGPGLGMRQWFHNPGVTKQPRPGHTLRTPSRVPPSPRALRCHALCTRPPATPRGRGAAGAGQVTYSGHNNHLTKPVPAARRPGSGGAWLQLCVCAMTSRSAAAVQVGRGSCVGVGGAQQCAVYSYISSHRHN